MSVDSIKSICDYLTIKNLISSNYKYIKTVAKVYKNDNHLFDDNVGVHFSFDSGFEQYSTSIEWSFDDDKMRVLGLHGTYNTKFQIYCLEDNCLVITSDSDDYKIVLE